MNELSVKQFSICPKKSIQEMEIQEFLINCTNNVTIMHLQEMFILLLSENRPCWLKFGQKYL